MRGIAMTKKAGPVQMAKEVVVVVKVHRQRRLPLLPPPPPLLRLLLLLLLLLGLGQVEVVEGTIVRRRRGTCNG